MLLVFACQKGEESLRKAHVFFKNGEYDAAEKLYRSTAEAEPNNVAAIEGLGNVAFERKEYEAAIAHYQKAIGIEKTAMSARHKLAVALTTANRPDEAIASLEETVKIDPKDAFAYNALGGLYQKTGDLGRAKQHQIMALTIDADFHAARFALGSLLVDLGELQEAEREFARLMTKKQDALAEYGFARLEAKRGHWPEAAAHLEKVLDAAVAHPEKIARDRVFAAGWNEAPMLRAKQRLDRAAGTKTSTATVR
jgi:tetratricopeptide (TPR) repeat protein